jgi:hypothetical protein
VERRLFLLPQVSASDTAPHLHGSPNSIPSRSLRSPAACRHLISALTDHVRRAPSLNPGRRNHRGRHDALPAGTEGSIAAPPRTAVSSHAELDLTQSITAWDDPADDSYIASASLPPDDHLLMSDEWWWGPCSTDGI